VAGADGRRRARIERTEAASDRKAAAEDREEAAVDRIDAGLDDLTGIFRRGTGEIALAHEVDRSRRLGLPLVLAMIDVDGLKAVNDEQGHPIGDDLLRDAVAAITSMTRSYDVTMRWGGDEFLCAMSNATLDVAHDRAAAICRELEALRPGASLTAGLAELRPTDTFDTLVWRADAALRQAKPERAA
jgi:diguanylate cyclase (GGDEF)-like protein